MPDSAVPATTNPQKPTSEAIEKALLYQDLSKLNEDQRLALLNEICSRLGLNSLTKPFQYIVLNGKLTLYATKDCTDQLRSLRKVSLRISSREKIGDVYVVTAQASTPDGRFDESTGAVHVGKAGGDILANLFMKAETKAKRRVTLSICGLGMLDEMEIESIPNVMPPPQAALPPGKITAIHTTAEGEIIDAAPLAEPEEEVVLASPQQRFHIRRELGDKNYYGLDIQIFLEKMEIPFGAIEKIPLSRVAGIMTEIKKLPVKPR